MVQVPSKKRDVDFGSAQFAYLASPLAQEGRWPPDTARLVTDSNLNDCYFVGHPALLVCEEKYI